MRAKIQNTALALFDRDGFDNVSMQDIAREAGCSIGNLYHYFKSKDELAIQVTVHVDNAYQEWETLHPRAENPALERLLDFVEFALETSAEEEVLYTAFIHGLKYPQQHTLKTYEERDYFRMLREMIEDCMEEGSIDRQLNVDDVRRELVILHRGTLFQWRIEESRFRLREKGRAMAEHLLKGLAPTMES